MLPALVRLRIRQLALDNYQVGGKKLLPDVTWLGRTHILFA